MPLVGGLGEIRDATPDAQHAADAVKASVEQKLGKSFETYQATKFGTQVVAGTNYFVKVNVGDDHLHLRVYRDLSGNYSLHSVHKGQTADSHLGYFDHDN